MEAVKNKIIYVNKLSFPERITTDFRFQTFLVNFLYRFSKIKSVVYLPITIMTVIECLSFCVLPTKLWLAKVKKKIETV